MIPGFMPPLGNRLVAPAAGGPDPEGEVILFNAGTGGLPAGWSRPWRNDQTITQVDSGGDLYLRIVCSATLGRGAIVYDAAEFANGQVLMEMRTTLVGTNAFQIGVAGRVTGASTTESGIAVRNVNVGGIRLSTVQYVAGTLTDTTHDVRTITANTWYRLRVEFDGSTVRHKLWLAADSEPVDWDADVTGASPTTAGKAGMFVIQADSDVHVKWWSYMPDGTAAHPA